MNANQVATTIAQQLGGFGRLQAMVGAYDFLIDSAKLALSFKFKGSRKANYIQLTLDPSDTYTVKFAKISRDCFEVKELDETSGVYCDQLIELFESTTGLYLSI